MLLLFESSVVDEENDADDDATEESEEEFDEIDIKPVEAVDVVDSLRSAATDADAIDDDDDIISSRCEPAPTSERFLTKPQNRCELSSFNSARCDNSIHGNNSVVFKTAKLEIRPLE
jgi:hypothetical protein